ncbi:MAG TPA: ATP-binding protein [Caulobacteraceae bacterium]|nr:ATP-binding protein [Caulobacteraceae bacterium]
MAISLAAHAQPSDSSARALAMAIEKRAEATSFAELERFGEAAGRQNGVEALRRLHHVAFILLNQSEFDRFDHFNGMLATKAQAAGNQRWSDVARIDALKARYDSGDTRVADQIARIADTDTDWFARIHAISIEALVLGNERKGGQALKLLFQADTLVQRGDPDAAGAESDIWGTIGIELIQLNDLEGSAEAFRKADFEDADKAYPRPDFDDVYNMAYLAVQLGDAKLARDIAAIHHRLASRSDLPHLDVWDKNLCAMVASSFGQPADVMQCLAGLDARLTGGEFLAPRLFTMRGIAEARLGRIEDAKADLARLRALEASQQFSLAAFAREPQLNAALLAAEGKDKAAYDALTAFMAGQDQQQAQTSSAGVRQVTAELERQLLAVQHQADLERDVVRSQRWTGTLASLLVLGAVLALLWQRRVARRLAVEREKAELASLAKSEFLANMSHEIRTPLNGVVGVADMLAQAHLPERERKMAEVIRASGQSLERLLSDVLDLARVEAGKLNIEVTPFNAADLVRSVQALCRLRADEKGLVLSARIAPELEGWFLGDSVRVRQILTNLTSNAVKFTERGSVTLVGEAPEPGCLRFSVVDTGVGFDLAQKERLFARFQQADGSITRRFGGSGLGLAISRQLAALMGGEVECESEPGKGSRFWFEAPFSATAAPAAAAEEEEPPSLQSRPIRVLVADDHATNQLVVRMMLEQCGMEAVVVEDGAQAVDAAARERFDVILMDMQMPVMGGLEATRLIRQEEREAGRPHAPILMLSANALNEHRDAARQAGADGHVAKPVTVAGLMAAIGAVLEPEGEAELAEAS